MAWRSVYSGSELSVHRAMPGKFFGYTARDWFKFYGLIAGLLFALVLSWTRYFELFEDVDNRAGRPYSEVATEVFGSEPVLMLPGMSWGTFITLFAGTGVLLVAIALLGFLWWAAGALVRYSKWMLRDNLGLFWQIFLFCIMTFLVIVYIDPMDKIHPQMSVRGRAPAPNLVTLLAGDWPSVKTMLADPSTVLFQFQWGYFLLYTLLWFLVVAIHWQYIMDGLRDVWFFTNRMHRYSASVLTGFRETADAMVTDPATRDYPRERPVLPPTFRGVPRLAVEQLSAEDARRIIAADASGAIVAAPGQRGALFVDLGRFDYSPTLAELSDANGRPLLTFGDYWAGPSTRRSDLVVPLRRSASPGEPNIDRTNDDSIAEQQAEEGV